MTLKDLLVKVGFEVEHEKLEGVEKQLHNIETLLEAFGAAEVLKGVYELSEKFGEMAEKLHLAAISAGITTEAYQKLAFAAEQNGVSQDELGGAIARISRQLYDARMGSEEAQKVFTQAGFHADQIASFKNGSDVLHSLADRFKGMKDPIKEMGILLPLAGRGSREMVAFMEQGGAGMRRLEQEAEELGAVLSGPQVEALVEVEHALKAIQSVFRTLAASIAAEFAPSIKSAIEEFLDFYKVNKDIIQLEMKKWVWDITYAMGAVWAVVKFVSQAFLDFAKNHETLVRRGGELVLAIGALASAIFVVTKAMEIAKIVFAPFGSILSGVGTVASWLSTQFMGLFGATEAVEAGALGTEGALGAMEVAAGGAGVAAETAGAGFLAMIAPAALVIAAIGAVIVVVHDLWKLLMGGSIKDTWIGGLVEWISQLSFVAKTIAWVKGLFGAGGAAGDNAMANLGGIPGITGPEGLASSTVNNLASSQASSSSEINAPITVNVPAGTDPRLVGDKVKEGVKEHLDRVHRETQRSLRPVMAY